MGALTTSLPGRPRPADRPIIGLPDHVVVQVQRGHGLPPLFGKDDARIRKANLLPRRKPGPPWSRRSPHDSVVVEIPQGAEDREPVAPEHRGGRDGGQPSGCDGLVLQPPPSEDGAGGPRPGCEQAFLRRFRKDHSASRNRALSRSLRFPTITPGLSSAAGSAQTYPRPREPLLLRVHKLLPHDSGGCHARLSLQPNNVAAARVGRALCEHMRIVQYEAPLLCEPGQIHLDRRPSPRENLNRWACSLIRGGAGSITWSFSTTA